MGYYDSTMHLLKKVCFFLIAFLVLAVIVAPSVGAVGLPSTVEEKCPVGWEHMKKSAVAGDVNRSVCCPPNSQNDPDNYTRDCFFAKYLNPSIRVLSALAGVAVIIGIIIGGIQYSSSGGDPQKSAAGKGKVMKSLYALFIFLFLFGILQFLSPGGIGSRSIQPVKPGIAKQCSKSFLGIQPWFRYLPDQAFIDSEGVVSCNIDNFALFGDAGTGDKSYVLNVALAVVDGLLRVVALVAVAFVIVGGAKYILSQGSPDGTKQAKDSILNALIGLVIAIVATAVVSFIGNRLT